MRARCEAGRVTGPLELLLHAAGATGSIPVPLTNKLELAELTGQKSNRIYRCQAQVEALSR